MEPASSLPQVPASVDAAPPRKTSARAQVIGILNIAFAVIFMGCAGIGLVSLFRLANQSRAAFGSDVAIYADAFNVLINAGGFLGLLAAGLLLLSKKMAGRTLTLVLAVAVPLLTIVYAILASALLTGVPSLGQSEATRIGTIVGVFLGSVGRALYPAIAGGVLLPKPEDLGLQN